MILMTRREDNLLTEPQKLNFIYFLIYFKMPLALSFLTLWKIFSGDVKEDIFLIKGFV